MSTWNAKVDDGPGPSRRGQVVAWPLDWFERGDILRQEIIEHGADGSDHRKLADVVPGGRNRRANEVGGEGKFESKQDPSRESDPDLPPFHLIGGFPEPRCHKADESLGCAEGDDKYGPRLDDERDVARDLAELLVEWNGRFPAFACDCGRADYGPTIVSTPLTNL